MSSTAQVRKLNVVPSSRPIIEAPGLHVVPTPAPARGFFGTVLLCATIFLGSLGTAFYLNTLMVAGAYELKDITIEQNALSAREATLSREVNTNSSPDQLRSLAKKFGMVPATSMLYVDTETGAITGPSNNAE
ncbi:hypothetical protein EBF03_03250 [Arcanobacterium haemolyticum]|uniref:Cell division protein FtsL n=1 Tax=Arcanobacterium haemolyticum (strain ATCC 9345 / DSM 20595 / CCM 5947 / CCUG 17215 / LMG 16163 / NBRC 15585 / NCTC 8452 / 11018) TaxID=644284 RepID=D7BNA2_ARCHD|nr:hypothetical protein [Arcanobacterium haemolyticum]ADH92401.1 conserved hypothetical protein [Arcanobacterium haemolyticum DSM 20595]QCX46536.1 hypothetical protein EBF03_03250 [Arcanobacterium haemolyticum]SPT74877.1 Uncharacterised protein [Arcanobacterium haemolyticum]SQH28871.1 Uncharacterised protein [Arcanobacterium haemolyticum]